MEAQRPELKVRLTTADKLLEVMAGGALLFLWIGILYSYTHSPDVVPLHFDLSGNPDGYGDKNSLFISPIIATFLYGLLTLINSFPHSFNYPVTITPENALEQYTAATRLIRCIKLAIIMIIGILEYQTYRIGLQQIAAFDVWVLPLCGLALFGPMAYYLIQVMRK